MCVCVRAVVRACVSPAFLASLYHRRTHSFGTVEEKRGGISWYPFPAKCFVCLGSFFFAGKPAKSRRLSLEEDAFAFYSWCVRFNVTNVPETRVCKQKKSRPVNFHCGDYLFASMTSLFLVLCYHGCIFHGRKNKMAVACCCPSVCAPTSGTSTRVVIASWRKKGLGFSWSLVCHVSVR